MTEPDPEPGPRHEIDGQPVVAYPIDLYAAVHAGNDGDVAYYQRQCQEAASVLEIGCGTGRIGSALVREGVPVHGIDVNHDAIGLAQERGLAAVYADMRDFDLGTRFEFVIAPYNVMYYALSGEELSATLRCIRRHLAPGGILLFDVYCPDALLYGVDLVDLDHSASPHVDNEDEPIMEIDALGRAWRVFEHSHWWPHLQRIDAYFRHVAVDGSETVLSCIPHRYVESGELADLLGDAGFGLLALEGDFQGAALDGDSELMVVRARAIT